MTLPEYLRLLRERWAVLAVAVALGLLGSGVVTAMIPQQYAASVTLYIVAEDNDPAGEGDTSAYELSLLSEQRIESYTQLLTSERITRDVVGTLRLAISPEELAGRLSASTEPDTVLVTAEVLDESPEQAARIANAVAGAFVRLVAEIEQPSDPQRLPSLSARVMEPAVPSTTPVAPKPLVNFAVGGLIGLIVGLGAVVLRSFTDSSFRSHRELSGAVGAPHLGSLGQDRWARRGRLVVDEDPQSQQAEAFRMVRTGVRSVARAGRGNIFVFTSALKGEGKSSTVCNLAMALSAADCRVVVVDANLREPRVAEYLGITSSFGLTDVLSGTFELRDAVQSWPSDRGGFDVLDAGSVVSNPSELLGSRRMAKILDELGDHYDFVLVDAPAALLVSDTAALARATDGVVLVYRYGGPRAAEVRAAIEALQVAGGAVIGTVMTMVPGRAIRSPGPADRGYRPVWVSGTAGSIEGTAAAGAPNGRPSGSPGSGSSHPVGMPTATVRDDHRAAKSAAVRPSPWPRPVSHGVEGSNGAVPDKPFQQD